MSKTFIYSDENPARLDVWLATQLQITRSQVQKLIGRDLVMVDGKLPKKTGDQLFADTKVEVLEKSELAEASDKDTKKKPFARKFVPKIIEETETYVVIEKPAGLAVHPEQHETTAAELLETETVAGWVVAEYPEAYGVGEYSNRPGIVHRLDKDTSGLMVIARTQPMFEHLKKQFQDRSVKKKYVALVHGHLPVPHGFLDFKIARAKDGRMAARPNVTEVTLKNVMAIQDGREALTEFSVAKEFVNYTLVDVTLHTGRTHQIRVHMFAYNHPLVGDPLYFNKKAKRDLDKQLGRVFLHSTELSFADLAGTEVSFTSPLPKILTNLLAELRPV